MEEEGLKWIEVEWNERVRVETRLWWNGAKILCRVQRADTMVSEERLGIKSFCRRIRMW